MPQQHAPLKVRWNTMNTAKYKYLTNRWIQEMAMGLEHDGTQKQALVEDVIAQLQNNLYETAVSVAGVKWNSRGPPRRRVGWDPSLKPLIQNLKESYWQLKQLDNATDQHNLAFLEHKSNKKLLRSTQRQLMVQSRMDLFREISEATDSNGSLFYRIVKKQRQTYTGSTSQMIFDDIPVTEDDLPNAWAGY